MKKLINYDDYEVNFNNFKVQWVKSLRSNSKITNDKLKDLIKLSESELFDIFYVGDDSEIYMNETSHKKLITNKPVLRYSALTKNSELFFELQLDSVKNKTYNFDSSLAKISGNKKTWHELLGNKKYIPKTVFTINDAEKLTYPIIAKPASGHSGIGIEKFNTFEELKSSKNKFDTYSNCVDFEREYRALIIKDKVFLIYERVLNQETKKNIENKSVDDSVDFVYIEQDINTEPYLERLNEIIKNMRIKFAPDFYAIDYFIDKEDKIWIIESNLAPGLGANSQAHAYLSLWKDFNSSLNIPVEKENIANKIIEDYRNIIKEDNESEYKISKNPK